MSGYCAISIDRDGSVVRREDFDASDDVQAMHIVQRYMNGHSVELWQSARAVAKLERRFDASGTLQRRMRLASKGYFDAQ
jgi:hypothetical protein